MRKKVIGSALLLLLVVGGVFATTQTALAQFITGGRSYIFDGVVTSVSSGSATVQTDSTDPLTLLIGRHTLVVGGSRHLVVGDGVKVIANQFSNGDTLRAEIIRITSTNASGYGSTGTVLVNDATIVSDSGGALVVRHNGINIRFTTNSSTRFIGWHRNENPTAGEHVVVLGQDNGSSFVARDVIYLRFRHFPNNG